MQTSNIRISNATNYRLSQFKKKYNKTAPKKLKNKSDVIDELLADHSLRSDTAILAYINERKDKGHEAYTILESLEAHLTVKNL